MPYGPVKRKGVADPSDGAPTAAGLRRAALARGRAALRTAGPRTVGAARRAGRRCTMRAAHRASRTGPGASHRATGP